MSYYDSEGNENPISPPLTGYNERIIKDLKHYGQGTYYQPLKMAKRLWALAVSLDDREVLGKIYPLFSTEAAMCYQINAEIETLVMMLEKWDVIGEELVKDGAYEDMRTQIDAFKMQIALGSQ